MKSITALSLIVLTTSLSFAGEASKKNVTPVESDRWKFLLAMPGWMPALEGDTGINNLVSHIDLDPGDLIRHYDMVISLRGEASKGRFGIMGDLLYTSMSDGVGTDTVVQKVDLQVDQTIAELALRWRVIENPRWSLDLFAGVRYTNLFQQVVTQSNGGRIDEVSTGLVNEVSERLRNGLADLGLRDLIAEQLRTRLEGFDPQRPPQVPVGPLGGRLAERLRARIVGLIESRRAELRAREEAVQAAVGAARVAAQARLDALKKDLSDKIARELDDKLQTRAARTDDWWDPFVGLRVRYAFNDQFYAMLRGDIGGFGVGSKLAWQAEAALGCYLTRSVFTEIGYRAYGVDYEKDGLTYDVVMYGAQVTLGVEF